MSARERIAAADALVAEAAAIPAPDLDDPGLRRVETILRALVASTSAVASAIVEANEDRRGEGPTRPPAPQGTPTRPYSGG